MEELRCFHTTQRRKESSPHTSTCYTHLLCSNVKLCCYNSRIYTVGGFSQFEKNLVMVSIFDEWVSPLLGEVLGMVACGRSEVVS